MCGHTHKPAQSAPWASGSQSSRGSSRHTWPGTLQGKPAKPPQISSFTQMPSPSQGGPQPGLSGSGMHVSPLSQENWLARPPPQGLWVGSGRGGCVDVDIGFLVWSLVVSVFTSLGGHFCPDALAGVFFGYFPLRNGGRKSKRTCFAGFLPPHFL